jgi:carbamoyl-phosphate synthase large subunit
MRINLSVLVTGIGAPGAKGTVFALRKGAQDSGVDLRLIGVDMKSSVAARGFCDAVYAIDGPASQNFGQQLHEICIEQKVDVVLPQTTREIEWLSKNRGSFPAAKIVVASMDALEISNNKIRTAEAFAKIGIPTPKFIRVHSELALVQAANSLGYPEKRVVVKLPLSNGMRGLRILNSTPMEYATFANEKPSGVECTLEELLRILRTAPLWPELMACEYLEGREYSVDCYRGRSGEIAIPRVRNEIRSGISFVTTLVFNKELINHCLHAARHIGLDGVFGFQFKEGGGIPKLLECNPRVQGTMIASLVTGNNIIWAAVADSVPEKVPPVDLSRPWEAGVCYRYWGATLSDDNPSKPNLILV